MQHLSELELARLVDEPAERESAEHLEQCTRCSAELAAQRAQRAEMAQLADPGVPAAAWARLERRLELEGLVVAPRKREMWRVARLAASIALFLLGVGAGVSVVPWVIAFGGGAGGAVPAATTVEQDAAARLLAAETEYLRALASYAEATGPGGDVDPVARLAALEGIVLTTRAALRDAPADPVINTYHLSALGQRDALLRELREAGETEWF